jgi:hypothetical protein
MTHLDLCSIGGQMNEDPLSDEAFLEWVRNQKDVYPRDAWKEARRRLQSKIEAVEGINETRRLSQSQLSAINRKLREENKRLVEELELHKAAAHRNERARAAINFKMAEERS